MGCRSQYHDDKKFKTFYKYVYVSSIHLINSTEFIYKSTNLSKILFLKKSISNK